MDDGLLMPDKPDGMATFPGRNGRIILIRNHELLPGKKRTIRPEEPIAVTWIDLENIDAPNDDLRYRGFSYSGTLDDGDLVACRYAPSGVFRFWENDRFDYFPFLRIA